MLFPTAGGVVMLTTAADAPSDVSWDALRVENSASPRVRATTGAAQATANGLAYDATGRLCYVDATAGLPADAYYTGGLPVNAAGALCVSTNAPATYSNGVPFAANGAVSVGITP